MAKTIFFVEDDKNIRELVLYALKNSGFQAVGYEVAKEFYGGLKSVTPDLILLDIMLPDEDGLHVLDTLKRTPEYKAIPVIMLTAKDSEYDKIRGLDSGADDYITKPFGVMELVSRIKAVLRRVERVDKEDVLSIGELTLDNVRHEVTVAEQPVTLTYKEYELLYYLLKNRDIVLTREKLLELVWNTDFAGESRTVDVHIGSLRSKLKSAGNYIHTIRGVGYKLSD